MWPRRYRGKWPWTITVANVTTCALLTALLYTLLSVLAVAAGVDSWPFIVLAGLLLLGVVLSVVSYPIASMAPGRLSRWLCYGANGGALLVYLMLCSGMVWFWIHTARRLFLVPAGFQGELYLVHGSGTPKSNPFWRTTYSFPNDGVLETPRQMPSQSSDRYQYIYPDGHTLEIKDAGPGTLQDTPENRSNTTEVVTYFGRTSQPIGPNDCYVEEILIGTRAFLLMKHSVEQPPTVTRPGICRQATP
jgi:hypothetical protein